MDQSSEVKPTHYDPARDSFTDLIARAHDTAVTDRLAPALLGPGPDLAGRTRDAIIAAMSGGDVGVAENLRRQCAEMKRDLAAEGASPLEALLIDRIAICWLALHYFEITYARSISNLNIQWSEFHQKRLDRANRRYLAAIKALANIRRLRLPLVQLNITDQRPHH